MTKPEKASPRWLGVLKGPNLLMGSLLSAVAVGALAYQLYDMVIPFEVRLDVQGRGIIDERMVIWQFLDEDDPALPALRNRRHNFEVDLTVSNRSRGAVELSRIFDCSGERLSKPLHLHFKEPTNIAPGETKSFTLDGHFSKPRDHRVDVERIATRFNDGASFTFGCNLHAYPLEEALVESEATLIGLKLNNYGIYAYDPPR